MIVYTERKPKAMTLSTGIKGYIPEIYTLSKIVNPLHTLCYFNFFLGGGYFKIDENRLKPCFTSFKYFEQFPKVKKEKKLPGVTTIYKYIYYYMYRPW